MSNEGCVRFPTPDDSHRIHHVPGDICTEIRNQNSRKCLFVFLMEEKQCEFYTKLSFIL